MRTVIDNPWVRAAGVVLALILVGVLAYALKPVLVPLFLALIVAYVLDPVVDFFEARRIPRMATIVGLAVVALVLLLSVPIIIIPSVFHQASGLIASARGVYSFEQVDVNRDGAVTLPELAAAGHGFDKNDFVLFDTNHDGRLLKSEWDEAMSSTAGARHENTLLDRVFDRLPVNRLVTLLELDKPKSDAAAAPQEGATQSSTDAPGPGTTATSPSPTTEAPTASDGQHDIDARALLAEYIGRNVRDFTVEFMKTHASSLASFGQKAGVNIFGFFTSVGQRVVEFLLFLANFALFAIVAGYLLRDFDPLKASASALIPPRYAPKALSILGKIDDQLRGFLRGQMTVCVCLGGMYMLGFLIFGVPFAVLIGLFAIAASFIPFVGVATTAVLGLLLTLLQHGVDWHLLGVLVVVVAVQFLEGNVLTPKIVGEQVGLNPVWVILAIMVFGNFLGFLGLLLAVPIAAALKVLVLEGVAYYKASPVFAGGLPAAEVPDDDTPVTGDPPRRKKRR